MLQSPTSELQHVIRVGLALGLMVIGGMVGNELRRRFAPKMGLREQDEVQAEGEQERLVRENRLRVVSQKPEWLKRWERHMAGVKRLGESRRVRSG